MDRKLMGLFTGTHLTAMVIAALIVPSSLLATAAYENVALLDPGNGRHATIDASGRLQILDSAVDGFANLKRNPANFVHVENGLGSGCNAFYTPPAGKAFILVSARASLFNSNSGNVQGLIVSHGTSCDETLDAAGFTAQTEEDKSFLFGTGIPIPAGDTVFTSPDTTISGGLYIEGYLVPAGSVPAVSPARRATPFGNARTVTSRVR